MPRTGRPKSKNPKDKKLTIQIEEDVRSSFFEKCEDEKIVASALIRKWILEFLENKKK